MLTRGFYFNYIIMQFIFSEHRRHFQQLHTGSSTEEVDNLMRKAWEDLEDRDKLRYFTRAKNAMKDENKHSNQFSTGISRTYS